MFARNASIASYQATKDPVCATWQALLPDLRIPRRGVVVEIGPGFSTRIVSALAHIGFCGTLIAVDPCRTALRAVASRVPALLPDVEFQPIQATLEDAGERLPRNVDALLANHVLDDMILRRLLAPGEADRWFANFEDPSSFAKVRTLWQRVAATGDLAAAIDATTDEVVRSMHQFHPRSIVFSQYESWVHATYEMDKADAAGVLAMRRLRAIVGTETHIENGLRDAAQDPSRWLACSDV